MTQTPNTPAELVALQRKDPIQAAMSALSPGAGGNLGHIQVVAQICIEIMQEAATDFAQDEDCADCAERFRLTAAELTAALALVERAPFHAINED